MPEVDAPRCTLACLCSFFMVLAPSSLAAMLRNAASCMMQQGLAQRAAAVSLVCPSYPPMESATMQQTRQSIPGQDSESCAGNHQWARQQG